MKKFLYILLVCILPMQATLLVPGNQEQPSPFTFTVTVTTKAYDCATGTLYLGLVKGAGDFAIAKAKRTFGSQEPKFIGIASDMLLSNKQIEYLTLAACQGDTNPLLGVVTAGEDSSEPQLFIQTKVIIVNNTGSQAAASEDLNDAGQPMQSPMVTCGIVQLIANVDFLFPVVRPHNDNDECEDILVSPFGDVGSGIGLVSILQECKKTDHDDPALTLLVRNAVTGSMGNQAIPLDNTSVVLKGNSGGAPVTFSSANRDINRVAGYWDDPLQRFYVGVRISIESGGNNIGKSVVVGRVDRMMGNRIQLQAIADDDAITPGGAVNEIVVARDENTSLTVKHIRVLHASTGPSYLIINGGKGTTASVGNLIFALPLVDLCDQDNPLQGTLANKNQTPLVDFRFTQPAMVGQLPNVFGFPPALPTDEFAVVGASELPLLPSMDIADIVVDGDTVYVSIADPLCNTNDTGVLYSEAMFDQDGKIERWTPWTKRAFPAEAFSNCVEHAVQFFAVDAVTAKVWAVDGITKRIVRITNWDKGCCPNLVERLQEELCCGSLSFLDLDQSTRGFFDVTLTTTATLNRYALFGGPDTVIFARVSQAFTNAINSSQKIIDDFCCPKNFLETEFPEPGGCPKVLEYARQLSGTTTNYFFAGTEKGLFVFAQLDGTGFDVASFGFLDQPPFSNGGWLQIKNITGAIIDIKTTGNTLYIITQETSCNALVSKVLRINFQPTIGLMFDETNIFTIAQSAVDILEDASFFKALGIISTEPAPGSTEQLVLATNAGLLRSAKVGGVQDATDQMEANWELVEQENMAFFNGIKNIDNASIAISPPTTIWPFNIADNQCETKQFTRGVIHQLNGTEDTGPFNFIPENFISKQFADCPDFETLDQIFNFWSDGNRRLFIQSRLNECGCRNKILSLPFDTCKWQIKDPCFQFLFDPLLDVTKYFHWISHIGVTGILMAGTDTGVVALE